MANDYSKLDKTVEYDHEAAEQLANLVNEVKELRDRADNLEALGKENPELHDFVWRTLEGEAIAVHKLEDDHLRNIIAHLIRSHRTVNKGIRAEARKRNILIPSVPHGVEPGYFLDMIEDEV